MRMNTYYIPYKSFLNYHKLPKIGIFMLREKELKWFYQGPGAGYVFPKEWEAYETAIPENERHDLIAAYGN